MRASLLSCMGVWNHDFMMSCTQIVGSLCWPSVFIYQNENEPASHPSANAHHLLIATWCQWNHWTGPIVSLTTQLPCISTTACLCQTKVAKLGIEVEIHDHLQVSFPRMDPPCCKLACLPFILAPSSTSAKQHSCSSGHDGQREVICCEGNSPGTWPIRVEAGGHCYVLVFGQFCSIGLQLVQQELQCPRRNMPWLGQKWTDSPSWYALALWLAANETKAKPSSLIQILLLAQVHLPHCSGQVTPSETWQGRGPKH